MPARLLQLIIAISSFAPSSVAAESPLLLDPPDEIIDIRQVIANATGGASCERVQELYMDGVSVNSIPVAFADLLLTGRCLDRDVDAAKSLLEKAANQYGSDANALARLGWMYEAGIGVDIDDNRATRFYRQAVGAMLPLYPHAKSIRRDSPYLSRIGGYTMLWMKDANVGIAFGNPADEAERWGITIGEAVFNFVDSATGPWDLPALLIEERDELTPFIEGAAADQLAVAGRFRNGSNRYPEDHAIAFEWVHHAATNTGDVTAMRTYLNWSQDRTFCSTGNTRCMRSPVSSNLILTNLAATGDQPALRALIGCLAASDMAYDELSDFTKKSLAETYPNAGSNQEALDLARASMLMTLENYTTTQQNAEFSEDAKSPFFGRKAFGSSIDPADFFWNTACPLS